MTVVCPACLGRFTLESRFHQTDGKCFLCGDNKTIDTEVVCECGRPAIRIVNKMMVCTFAMCEKRAMEKKVEVKTIENLQDNFSEIYGVG
jgi:hypothetical protein